MWYFETLGLGGKKKNPVSDQKAKIVIETGERRNKVV